MISIQSPKYGLLQFNREITDSEPKTSAVTIYLEGGGREGGRCWSEEDYSVVFGGRKCLDPLGSLFGQTNKPHKEENLERVRSQATNKGNNMVFNFYALLVKLLNRLKTLHLSNMREREAEVVSKDLPGEAGKRLQFQTCFPRNKAHQGGLLLGRCIWYNETVLL